MGTEIKVIWFKYLPLTFEIFVRYKYCNVDVDPDTDLLQLELLEISKGSWFLFGETH